MKKINKIYLLCLLSFFIQFKIIAQDTSSAEFQVIELNEFYDKQGVIIPSHFKSYWTSWFDKEPYQRFTPTLDEIIEAETIMRYILYMILGQNEHLIKVLNKRVGSYYRQYTGLYNEKGEKVIWLIMCDFSNSKEKEKYLEEFRKQIMYYSTKGEDYLFGSYYINLDTREIEKKSDLLIDNFWFLGNY